MSDMQVVPVAAEVEAAKVEQQASSIEYKADLIYGASDSGKTKNEGDASDYVLEKYGKLGRLATADGGGAVPGLAGSGQLETWAVGAWKNPIEAMDRAVRGYWPARLDDPESVLLAPDAGTWEIYGFYGFEGLTSWGDAILMNLKQTQASLSQDPSYSFKQGEVTFSGGNRSYYGFIQDQLYAWVAMSHLLPVHKVLWTALESRGDDSDGQPVYGPAIAGKKSISKASQWFKNTVHIDIISKPSSEIAIPGSTAKLTVAETERVMWLRTHADPLTKINFPAKIRVPAKLMAKCPPYLIPPNIGELYKLIDKLEAEQIEDSKGRMSNMEEVRERLLKAAALAKQRQEKAAVEKAKRAGSMPSFSLPTMVRPVIVGAPVVVAAASAPTVAAAQPQAAVEGGVATVTPTTAAAPSPVAAPLAIPGQAPVIQQLKRPAAKV